MLATDIKTVRDDKRLTLIKAVSLGYLGLMENVGNGAKADTPFGKDAPRAPGLGAQPRPRGDQPGRVQRRVRAGQPVGQPAEPVLPGEFPIPKRDVAKAKALLKEAGVTGPVTLDFLVANGPENRAVAEVVQSMAAEAGFDVKIRVTEFATSIKAAEDGDFQIYLFGWSGRADPDGNAFIIQACNAGLNYGKYCDKDVDAWHDEARSKTELADRKKAYEKITAKVLPEGDFIYLYHPQVLIALSGKVEGYKQMPDGLVRVIGVKLK